ncbi:pyridoxine 5'-phosphate oxidase C-terminal domain-containing protein [Streptomyces sp. NPDC058861]|uniref:pyridoxine 5'-phosphate oxidase C-terminal domain-containing protein n=1 Tax=Streptomyces sp. NPDC058861 TaxID=3346653 RepID=UPI003693425F
MAPTSVEFWQAGASRAHSRLNYERTRPMRPGNTTCCGRRRHRDCGLRSRGHQLRRYRRTNGRHRRHGWPLRAPGRTDSVPDPTPGRGQEPRFDPAM